MTDLRKAITDAYLADEDRIAAERITEAQLSPAENAAVQVLAREIALRIRNEGTRRGGVDAFTQEYALSTEEGVALMCLAEALLRVPDAETADRLIRDKIAPRDWDSHAGKSESLFVNASTWALMLTGRIVRMGLAPEWDFENIIKKLVARSGEPVIRQAITAAMRVLGGQFVLGRTMAEAMKAAKVWRNQGYRYSFDMLGEAAYTAQDAERHMQAYRSAIEKIADAYRDDESTISERPSISVKLSALHPRYEWVKRERVIQELLPQLVDLAVRARAGNVALTIDAEEADRLELMLDLFETLLAAEGVAGWSGLGIAVQAYQKRGLPEICWLIDLARRNGVRIPVRLVKGAYWDTEIKRAQEAGLIDYPVFTRKAATDTSYIACARAMLGARDAIFSQFATHNAHTLSSVEVLSGGHGDFEYQRLHGMGESLYELYREVKKPSAVGAGTRIYAPVGSHEDLLAYLVRRLLENGANTSFVNRMADEEAPIDVLIADPVAQLAKESPTRNPRIPVPKDMLPGRINSSGFLWSDATVSAPTLSAINDVLREPGTAGPIVGGVWRASKGAPVFDPANRQRLIGHVSTATPEVAREALELAHQAQTGWDKLGGEKRAGILEKAADIFEENRVRLLALIVREGGKTLPTALSELREAIDYLRYYGGEARKNFSSPVQLPGPTGETNELTLHGKGVFACISPWNFPLAIFTGQVAGALASGNAVLAKPAGPTPMIAAAAVELLHRAGVPGGVLHLLPGSGSKLGAVLFPDPRLTGVILTGSTEAAMAINRALAAREGALATVVAETGGQNAMIVDSTALPEQVARDVIASAFDSAGQRCSALRVLFLQDDVADRMLEMILGAMDEIKVGDPMDLSTDVGPVIDEASREGLEAHAARFSREATLLRKLQLGPEHRDGTFFPPLAFEIDSINMLRHEVFGPVLHVVRYAADRLDKVCEAINSTGFGLTLGIHSRIESTATFIRDRVRVGNIYVNRNQIGAVVGVQPFGGEGLSGTGPKAGGPHYMLRFALERTYTVNTTASGGNAALLSSG
ncbi:MAG: bifunctional proline dehydrogenase/L-glutamate gamma-semialdehyde dehydrogenase PutA [Alphaproteobacteria bacterium]|nr:bifunctional proline dehydrogenase/L-glutamate gamma-semialdehyde dehydrogenase PutA [Alphaproteobacteria bacterium]